MLSSHEGLKWSQQNQEEPKSHREAEEEPRHWYNAPGSLSVSGLLGMRDNTIHYCFTQLEEFTISGRWNHPKDNSSVPWIFQFWFAYAHSLSLCWCRENWNGNDKFLEAQIGQIWVIKSPGRPSHQEGRPLHFCEFDILEQVLQVNTREKSPQALVGGEEKSHLKYARVVLAGIAQLFGASSCNQKVAGLIPGQDTCLGCGFIPFGVHMIPGSVPTIPGAGAYWR